MPQGVMTGGSTPAGAPTKKAGDELVRVLEPAAAAYERFLHERRDKRTLELWREAKKVGRAR